MKSILKKSWPEGVPETLTYRLDEKPLHEYVLQNAKDYPTASSYTFYGNELSWEELANHIKRFAQFLASRGVQKGSHVALYMQNCPQYLIGHYAVQLLGATVVPLNPMYKSAELAYFINEAEIQVILAGQELYSQIEGIEGDIPSLQFVVTTHYADFLTTTSPYAVPPEVTTEKQAIKDTFDLLEAIETYEPFEDTVEINLWEDVGLLVFTSGTTGRPKAAKLTFGNALFKTAASAQAYSVNEQDTTLATAPFCHIAGMVMGVNMPVYTASHCVLLTRFDPSAAVKAIEQYQVSKMYTIAPMNAAILHYAEVEKHDLSSLKVNFATSFSMNVDEKLATAWAQLTDGCILFEAAYGLSETHTCDTFMPVDKIKHGSCGIATYDTDLKIIDPTTNEEVPLGEDGEIAVKSPGVFKGYLNRPEETAATLRDGYVFTGDIGTIDEEGYLYFKGRTKELIKSSGFSVFPEDVESLMSEHEAIYQVAVIGVPDEARGESVKAFIVLKPDFVGKISEDEMIAWAKNQMAAYKYPRAIEFREELPATSSGKILRRLLQDNPS